MYAISLHSYTYLYTYVHTVTTNQSKIILKNLQPNTLYNYRVVAENGLGNGGSTDYGEFTTLPLPPLSPPRNVQVIVINSTAVNMYDVDTYTYMHPQMHTCTHVCKYATSQLKQLKI